MNTIRKVKRPENMANTIFNSLLVSWIEAVCNMHNVHPVDLDYELVHRFLTKIGTMTDDDVKQLYENWYVELHDQLSENGNL